MSEWISVEERLPEENEKVLIICKNKAMFVADYYLFTNSDEQVWRTYGALGTGRRVATNRITHIGSHSPNHQRSNSCAVTYLHSPDRV